MPATNLGSRTNNATNMRNSRAERTDEQIGQDNENACVSMLQLRTTEARAERNQQRELDEDTQSSTRVGHGGKRQNTGCPRGNRTAAERQRDYRLRLRQKRENTIDVIPRNVGRPRGNRTGAQRQRDFRLRQRQKRENNINVIPRKPGRPRGNRTGAQRLRDYRQRLREKRENAIKVIRQKMENTANDIKKEEDLYEDSTTPNEFITDDESQSHLVINEAEQNSHDEIVSSDEYFVLPSYENKQSTISKNEETLFRTEYLGEIPIKVCTEQTNELIIKDELAEIESDNEENYDES